VLLWSGKTTEELREQVGDSGIGDNKGSTSQNEGNVYDELVKDLAGDFISLLVEDKLRTVTKLDVARIEIGTNSVGIHAEKELANNFKLLGDRKASDPGLAAPSPAPRPDFIKSATELTSTANPERSTRPRIEASGVAAIQTRSLVIVGTLLVLACPRAALMVDGNRRCSPYRSRPCQPAISPPSRDNRAARDGQA
jgi:hypothetical protein